MRDQNRMQVFATAPAARDHRTAALFGARAAKPLDQLRDLSRWTVKRGREPSPLSRREHESSSVGEQPLGSLATARHQELRQRLVRSGSRAAEQFVVAGSDAESALCEALVGELSQQRTLLSTAQRERATVLRDLKRPKYPKLHAPSNCWRPARRYHQEPAVPGFLPSFDRPWPAVYHPPQRFTADPIAARDQRTQRGKRVPPQSHQHRHRAHARARSSDTLGSSGEIRRGPAAGHQPPAGATRSRCAHRTHVTPRISQFARARTKRIESRANSPDATP